MTDNRTNELTEAQARAVRKLDNVQAILAGAQASVTDAVRELSLTSAALVAAQGAAPSVGRRPKRLLNQLNRIADALEEYEFDGVAADAPAWMRKAAEYIESERQWRAPVLPSSGVDEAARRLIAWPTVDEVRETFKKSADRLAFDRMIAEVERAAAEKAWWEACVRIADGESNLDIADTYQKQNPYLEEAPNEWVYF